MVYKKIPLTRAVACLEDIPQQHIRAYPPLEYLTKAWPKINKRQTKKTNNSLIGNSRRINIVSTSLCDHVIDRLKHSSPPLKQYKNCDVVDINPGAGLWSSKLHEFLQPRRHILFEPDLKLYQPCLQPLLDQENSRYHLFGHNPIEWEAWDRFFEDRMLPEQNVLKKNDAARRKTNDTLLFIGNLGLTKGSNKRQFSNFDTEAKLFIHQLLTASRRNHLFHRYGLVRMLIWISKEDRHVYLPHSVADRRKVVAEIEAKCEKIEEVAGPEPHNILLRDHELNVQSSMNVIRNMRERGLSFPFERTSKIQNEAERRIEGFQVADNYSMTVDRSWGPELDSLQARYQNKEFPKWTVPKREGETRKHPPEYKRMKILEGMHAQQTKLLQSAEYAIEEEARLIRNEKTVAAMPEGPKRKAATKDLHALHEKHTKYLAAQNTYSERVQLYLHDKKALSQEPPLLLWDRRSMEPLIVDDEEFFPRNALSLLDFQPAGNSPLINSENLYDTFSHLIGFIFMNPTQSLSRALSSIQPGAAEYIIPRMKSLVDVTRAGRWHPEDMKVRMLTLEMLVELTSLWEEWPFRPTRPELFAKLGMFEQSTFPDGVHSDRLIGSLL